MKTKSKSGFSILEMMIATVILLIILGVIFGVTQQTSKAWKNSSSKIESFQTARSAFELMTRCISQATLNSYWGYDNTATPTEYLRKSELHFISGKSLLKGGVRQVTHSIFFQAPLGYSDDSLYAGIGTTLNACGFFVEYNKDESVPLFFNNLPHSIPNRHRYRLMQWIQPTQKLAIYQGGSGSAQNTWFSSALSDSSSSAHPVADNIVALIILPKRRTSNDSSSDEGKLAPDYEYDSRNSANQGAVLSSYHQLPSLVKVVMVAVDETSFLQLGSLADEPRLGLSSLFQQASDLESDLQKLQEVFDAKPENIAGNKIPLKSRVFRTDIPIWSSK